MIGTWDIEVTLRSRETGHATGSSAKPLRAVNTFTSGGALIETGAHAIPNLSSPGQGTWRHICGQNYAAVLRFFHFNPDGSVAWTRKVTRHLELSKDGNEFTGTASIEVFDADDRLVTAHCATETARRFG
jgi:hypothetical protein